MNPLIIPAESLTVGVGRHSRPTNGGNTLPIVSMNFLAEHAQEVVDRLLRPHARPEHFFVGVRRIGAAIEVGCFCVFRLPYLVSLPHAAALIFKPETFAPGPTLYVIGTTADIAHDTIHAFLKAHQQLGWFYLICGVHPKAGEDVTLSASPWRIRLTSLVADVHRSVDEAIARLL